MAEDVSRKTIIVLVFLTLIVSILGTWTVMSSMTNPPVASSSQDSPVASGEVSFVVGEPAEPVVDMATGHVALNIVEKGE